HRGFWSPEQPQSSLIMRWGGRRSALAGARQDFAGYAYDGFRREAEFGLEGFDRRRRPEGRHRHDRAVGADPTVPAERRRLLDGDPGPPRRPTDPRAGV